MEEDEVLIPEEELPVEEPPVEEPVEEPSPVVIPAFRNAWYSTPDQIDMEMEHPRLGWIPITISEAEYPDLWVAVVASEPLAYQEPTDEELAAELQRMREGMKCSPFQAKVVLHGAGYLQAVEAMMVDADFLTRLAWQEAVEFRRLSPSIVTLGHALGLSDEEMDDLFRAAVEIAA